MSIALAGYRGSGKTTVGRLLAAQLGKSFIDCDDLIVDKAGKSIREIFIQSGEASFREMETEAIRRAMSLTDHVIALGGGALIRDENRRLLARPEVRLFYLRCDPAELLRRIQADSATTDNRPSLTPLGGDIEEIKYVLSEREPIYRAAMTAELDVTRLTPEQAAAHLLNML